MKKTRPNVSAKLKAYSAMAASVLAAGSMDADVIYTDIEPDIVFDSHADIYSIDINSDGQNDFAFFMGTNTYPGVFMGVIPYGYAGSINAWTGSSGAYNYPIVNLAGSIISSDKSWQPYNGYFMTMASVSYLFVGPYGNWFDIADGYLGLRINVGEDQHYAWARLDASADGFTFTLKDMAYNDIVDEGICAGDMAGPADDCISALAVPTWIGNMDIADNGNGLDLGFSFNASGPETGISEYRVIAVKSAAAPDFSLILAATMSGDQVVTIPATGLTTYASNCVANSTDSDGDPITYGVAYKLFIYCVGPDYPAVLSNGSIDITLSQPVGITSNEVFSGVTISPNPAEDFVTVNLSEVATTSTITIVNSVGEAVMSSNATAGASVDLNIANLPAGNYFVRISDGVATKTIKFIKL